MKASALKPPAEGGTDRNEWLYGASALVIGAALAYGGVHLFALLRPEAFAAENIAPQQPEKLQPRVVTPVAPPPPGEDPWWRGDAAFWQEQARLNAAAVAPQYREIQIAWAEKMAVTAKLRAQQASNSPPLALPAKSAVTTELTVTSDDAR